MITQTKPTISFYTLGCRLNQSETAVIQNSFKVTDYDVVDFESAADIVVINTCTVTENGDADTRRLVNKINRMNPNSRIALIGCQAQVQKEKLTKLKNVRWVIGNAKKFDLASILSELADPKEAQVIAPTISRDTFSIPFAGVDTEHTRANIKIQDGCDFFCSFCEIPYARGRARSRDFNNLIDEAQQLAAAGHKEIVLTGINLGTYHEGDHTINDVIEQLETIPNLKRIRISSIEPTTIPKKLIQKMADRSKLCRYLHIPLQSGSDSVLKDMQRKYTVKEFLDFIDYAYQTVPDVCIGTDVIVGFPGETDKDFQTTCDLLRESPIHYFHVFSYSARTMARSRQFTNEVAHAVIQERSRILRELSMRKRRVFLEQSLKRTVSVLFEQEKDGFWNGVTDNYIRVKVKTEKNLENTFRDVKLEELNGQAVIGSLV